MRRGQTIILASRRLSDGMICTTKGPTSKTPKFELDRLKCKTVHRCLAIAVDHEAHGRK
ncbi:hypothetical protein GALMADRAFT_237931, partial [Galerina marginata CBS 339.88]